MNGKSYFVVVVHGFWQRPIPLRTFCGGRALGGFYTTRKIVAADEGPAAASALSMVVRQMRDEFGNSDSYEDPVVEIDLIKKIGWLKFHFGDISERGATFYPAESLDDPS